MGMGKNEKRPGVTEVFVSLKYLGRACVPLQSAKDQPLKPHRAFTLIPASRGEWALLLPRQRRAFQLNRKRRSVPRSTAPPARVFKCSIMISAGSAPPSFIFSARIHGAVWKIRAAHEFAYLLLAGARKNS